jgi:hypothetical protein
MRWRFCHRLHDFQAFHDLAALDADHVDPGIAGAFRCALRIHIQGNPIIARKCPLQFIMVIRIGGAKHIAVVLDAFQTILRSGFVLDLALADHLLVRLKVFPVQQQIIELQRDGDILFLLVHVTLHECYADVAGTT